MPSCVLCLKNISADPSAEHIIPQGLGGWLTIPFVCGECNNTLGHELEGMYKRNGYIARALQTTGLQTAKDAYRFADIHIKFDDGKVQKALFDDDDQIRMIPQPSPDDPDSVIIPEAETIKVLATKIARFEKKAGKTVLYDLSIFDDLPKDVIITIPGTDIGFIKRSNKSESIIYSGLSNPIPYRGIAYLAFKQLAAFSPNFALQDQFDPIRKWIRCGGDSKSYVVLNYPIPKVDPSQLDYKPYHYLMFHHVDGALGCIIVLFDQLVFSVYLGDLPEINDETVGQCLNQYFIYDLVNKRVIAITRDDEKSQQELTFIRAAINSARFYRKNG